MVSGELLICGILMLSDYSEAKLIWLNLINVTYRILHQT